MKLYTSDDVEKVLPAYARISAGSYGGHIIVRPKSNLKPFSQEQEQNMQTAVAALGFRCVGTDEHGERIKPGYGFRLFRS